MDKTDFFIEIKDFNEGLSPVAHIDTDTYVGSSGQAGEMIADTISLPGYLTQSPGLANLTNGTQAGVVDQLIRHILDTPTGTDTTYAVGTTKMFKLSSTAVASGGSPSWPQTVTDMTEGESVARLKANVYVFYNKASGGDIAKMVLSTEVITAGWGSSTDQALESAPHPVAVKEDIMIFGNGRYAGVYIEGSAILDVQKLDFGEGNEVVDVVFHANMFWFAVNSTTGRKSQIYLYDGSALSSVLADEAGLGSQKIGFLYVLNGITYVAYDDLTSDGYAIGWLSGRTIKPLRYFSGSLPSHRQKTLYKNMILFTSSDQILACGATIQQYPIQLSILADGGYSTLGAIAAPFGTPYIASSDGAGNYRLAKFSGYSTTSSWKSIYKDVSKKRYLGKIHTVIVQTKSLGANARADITLYGNQGEISTAATMSVTGEDVKRHVFRAIDLDAVEDVRVKVDYANGNTTNPCPIRKITLLGNYVER